MHRRLLPLSVAAALLLPLFANAQDSTLAKAKQTGTFTISYRDSSIPFSYLNDKGEPVGFAYEICERIADNVKKAIGKPDLKVNKQLVTSANRIPLLINGTIDDGVWPFFVTSLNASISLIKQSSGHERMLLNMTVYYNDVPLMQNENYLNWVPQLRAFVLAPPNCIVNLGGGAQLVSISDDRKSFSQPGYGMV